MQHSLHAYGAWILQVYKFPAYQPTKGSIESSLASRQYSFFVICSSQASLYWLLGLFRSKSSLSMEAEVGNCAPFLLKIAPYSHWAATVLHESFFICLLPVIHLIHLGHQSCLNKNLLIPGVPLKMSFISFCPPLPVRFPPRQKPLLLLTLNFWRGSIQFWKEPNESGVGMVSQVVLYY